MNWDVVIPLILFFIATFVVGLWSSGAVWLLISRESVPRTGYKTDFFHQCLEKGHMNAENGNKRAKTSRKMLHVTNFYVSYHPFMKPIFSSYTLINRLIKRDRVNWTFSLEQKSSVHLLR